MAETPRRRHQHVKFKQRSATGPAGSAGKPSSEGPPKPQIQVSRPTESVSFVRGMVLSFLLIAALVAAVVYARGNRPDPHFVSATQMLSLYERGRNEEARNYRNEVYERALEELDRVDPESVSFAQAQSLRREIVNRRDAFFVKMRQAENRKETRRESKSERREELAAKQAHSRMHRQVEYPECDD